MSARAAARRALERLRVDLPDTLLRMFPRRAPVGLTAIGQPGPDSPVLLTGNFRLTVARVRRALVGLDAWLLVADSAGVNVWCAATGGHLTDHDVVAVLKTTGVGERVSHRRVILPQLAATGIDGATIRERAGWRVIWGPVRATDLPAFLAAGHRATPAMRQVAFPWPQRLEMAIAWAFPISVLAAAVGWVAWPSAWPRLVALVWGMSLALFLAFPLYGPGPGDSGVPGRAERAVPLVAWAVFVALLVIIQTAGSGFHTATTLRWGVASLAVALVVALDLSGSTPVLKSGLHADRRMRIELDAERCTGAGFCETVCPVRVFEVDHHRKTATLPRAAACVQCGACIVQCPFDALHFRMGDGAIVGPETVRRYRLNLLGKRAVAVGRTAADSRRLQ